MRLTEEQKNGNPRNREQRDRINAQKAEMEAERIRRHQAHQARVTA